MKKTICIYLTLVLILAGCGNLKRQITGTVKPADQLIPSDNPPESGKDKKIVGDIKGVGGDKQDNENLGSDNNKGIDNTKGGGENNSRPPAEKNENHRLKDIAKGLWNYKGSIAGIAAVLGLVIGVHHLPELPDFCVIQYVYNQQEQDQLDELQQKLEEVQQTIDILQPVEEYYRQQRQQLQHIVNLFEETHQLDQQRQQQNFNRLLFLYSNRQQQINQDQQLQQRLYQLAYQDRLNELQQQQQQLDQLLYQPELNTLRQEREILQQQINLLQA